MRRRDFVGSVVTGNAFAHLAGVQQQGPRPAPAAPVFERGVENQPHVGKVLLALGAHSDDVPLFAAGTVAKLIEEGYTGYLVRATNDDMGDAAGLGTPGSNTALNTPRRSTTSKPAPPVATETRALRRT